VTTYGYVRSSRPPKSVRTGRTDPTDSPLGIESQRREILDVFPDAVIFEDRFKSGRSARRPGLRAMLDRVEPGDRVVVSRLDRLARDSRLATAIEYEVETTREARLVSLRGEGTNLDGSPPDPTAVFLRRVLAAQAELAAAQASAATKSALAVKRAAGISTNGAAPYGYRVEPDGRIVEDDQEQAVVSAIVERVRGRLWAASSSDIAEHLTRAGFRNRAGKPWHRSGIARILRGLEARQKETVET
jgi:DNA invertase Pin-like site-specific DNA recombinase